jgi:hypothetical protein
MMHEHKKSDSVIVAMKPANKAEQPTAVSEAVAQREGVRRGRAILVYLFPSQGLK